MNTQATCPSCGKAVAGDAPQGLCPECLMKGGMATTAGGPASGAFVPPSVHEIAQLFPQMEIIEMIGHGGMGAVYKARQPALDRLVALKILPPRPGNDPGFADRFTQEARALARLSHPNIVAVHDFGQAGRLHYFLMEYVDGPNLRQLEQSAKLAPSEALKIIPQICEALQYAHEEGIVHRDIKPENVLLDKKGRVKIADFGLAKLLGQPPQIFRLTGTRDVMGTPHYMAPEQIEHPQDVDHRADIYSLGVVFYEMLTGELPLGRFGPPSSRAREVKIDVRLDEVVLRALEREPERRYQQASEVKTDLESIAGDKASGSRQPPPPPLTRMGTSAAAPERLRKDVCAPAYGLLVTGILNWVLLLPVLGLIFPYLARANPSALEGLSKPAFIVLFASPFVLCSFIIYAALKMQRLEAYRAAVAASILAMVVTPGNIIGFPIGIWALVTLLRRDVRVAFEQVRAKSSEPGLSPGRRAAVQVLIWGGAAVMLLAGFIAVYSFFRSRGAAALTQTPSSMEKVLLAASATDRPLSEEVTTIADGSFQATCTSTQVFRLFEVPAPGVENCTVVYQAKARAEGLNGRAYLEMWCRFPARGESFSRGFDNAIMGTTGWVTTQTPFFLKRGEKPDLIRLNLVMEGPGKVFIKDIRLGAAPARQ